MGFNEKTREIVDDAGKELKAAIDSLGKEVSELTKKLKDRLKGTGKELKETAEELTEEVKKLSERVKGMIFKKGKTTQMPVHVERFPVISSDKFEHPLFGLQRPDDRQVEDFFRNFRPPSGAWESPFSLPYDFFGHQWPRVDMTETDDEIRISAELPGVEKDALEISSSAGKISIRGEKKAQEEDKKNDYYRLERTYGAFQRTFNLPCEIDEGRIDASFKNGVLKIHLPKTEAARQRIKKIPVKSI